MGSLSSFSSRYAAIQKAVLNKCIPLDIIKHLTLPNLTAISDPKNTPRIAQV